MQQRSLAVRRQNKAARTQAMLANTEDLPLKRAKMQVDKVLLWMERCNDREEYSKLVVMLDKLWSKAYPTQAAVKSSRSRQPVAPVAPISPVNPVGESH